MATISQYLHEPGPLPFVDVELDQDNRQFVDPFRIRISPPDDVPTREAVLCLDTFASAIFTSARSNDSKGLALLQQFTEPKETRLGMSSSGYAGHGGAEEIGARTWTALTTDLRALLVLGDLGYLEDLPLFIDGVDCDITSDIATRIIYGPLAAYTMSMAERYPRLGADVRVCRRRVWSPNKFEWEETDVQLPFVDGQPLLLVPSTWAGPSMLLKPRRFYDTLVLTHVQDEEQVVDRRGNTLRTPKRVLRRRADLRRRRSTNLQVTLRAHRRGRNIIREFRSFARVRYLRKQGIPHRS